MFTAGLPCRRCSRRLRIRREAGRLTGGEGLPMGEDAHGLPQAPGEAAEAFELMNTSMSPSARLQGKGGGAQCWEEWRPVGTLHGSIVTW